MERRRIAEVAKYSFVRKALISFVVACVSLSWNLFAQDLVAVYASMDKAFALRSGEAVSTVLKANQNSASYEMLENYTLKKTRQMIIKNDLEFAREASLAVIDNNVENYDAIDLYAYIDKALVGEEQKKKAEEERKQRELARQAALKDKARQQIETRGSYQTVSASSGKSGYVNDQKITYSPMNWTVKFGIADFMYQTVTEPESYASIKYGLAFGADLYYPTENFILGGDIFADFQFLSLTGEQEVMFSGRIVPQLAFAGGLKYLFFRMGFAAYPLSSQDLDKTHSVETFFSPVVGIGLGNINIDQVRLGVHADYNLGHFAYDDLKLSAEAGGSVMFPLSVNEKTKIGIELGVSDVLFVKEEGVDNRIKGIFAIGVGNVQK